jgi:hypothetical protein
MRVRIAIPRWLDWPGTDGTNTRPSVDTTVSGLGLRIIAPPSIARYVIITLALSGIVRRYSLALTTVAARRFKPRGLSSGCIIVRTEPNLRALEALKARRSGFLLRQIGEMYKTIWQLKRGRGMTATLSPAPQEQGI